MNITQLIKLGFDLKDTKGGYGKPYSFMRKLEGQYTWTSLHEKMDITIQHDYVNFSTQEKPLYQISDLFDSTQTIDPWIKNVLILSDEQVIIIQRHGNSKFYIADDNIPDNAAEDGLLQEFDILDFTEEEYFQLSVLYPMPSIEEFRKLANHYNDLQKLSTDNNLEITLVWNEFVDIDNIPHFTEEDFDGYRFK